MTVSAPSRNLNEEREDTVLNEAFAQATAGAITRPNILQRALFPRLLSQDTGILVPTASNAGRLEAVFVPSLTNWPDAGSKQRLFVIGPDRGVLDDYAHRLIPYIQALAAADGQGRTVYFAEDGSPATCDRYQPDGTVAAQVGEHPLYGDVDLVVTCFSEFRALFFGSGGVNGIAQPVVDDAEEFAIHRRDLFYFDEAHGYSREEFVAFLRLIEFLFAEDLDVVIGSSTLPASALEELSFLDVLYLPDANEEPLRSIRYVTEAEGGWLSLRVSNQLRAAKRAILVGNDAGEVAHIADILGGAFDREPIIYLSGMRADDRRAVYSVLKCAEASGDGYILIADAAATECADLSADLLVTGVCAPEGLLRRSGRCNRRNDFSEGTMLVVESLAYVPTRRMPADVQRAYIETLSNLTLPTPFKAAAWIPFVG